MPEHAFAGWLTDQPSSVTIKTTPSDRLAITGKIMGRGMAFGCDPRHMGKFCGYYFAVPGDYSFPMINQLRFLQFSLFLFASMLLAPTFLGAQVRKACEGGITLKLSSGITPQGSLILAEITSTKLLPELTAEWDGKPMPLWKEGETNKTLHGLLGVDLEKAPGKYDWKCLPENFARKRGDV